MINRQWRKPIPATILLHCHFAGNGLDEIDFQVVGTLALRQPSIPNRYIQRIRPVVDELAAVPRTPRDRKFDGKRFLNLPIRRAVRQGLITRSLTKLSLHPST